MYKYYIPEIDLNKLNYSKIKKNSKLSYNNYLISLDGLYKLDNENINKYIMMDYDVEDLSIDDYLDMSITLLMSKYNWKKINTGNPFKTRSYVPYTIAFLCSPVMTLLMSSTPT